MPASLTGSGVTARLYRGDWILAALFAAAYGQWPLYSSNQNTYFVRGVAWATGGPLASDWFVRTTDHVPLFSAYVLLITRWLSPGVFFLVHGALLALYALCLVYLVRRLFGWTLDEPAYPVFFLGLTLVHSDVVAAALSSMESPGPRLLASAMGYATEGIGGHPLLRHFHQPSAFGVLLLLSTCLFLAGRERAAVVSAALAAWFHPVYLLTSAVLACLFVASAARQGRYRGAARSGALWLVASLPPLVYTGLRFAPTSPDLASEARRILVHERFPHHADPAIWFGWPTVLQLAIVVSAAILVRRDRALSRWMATLFAVASALTMVQVATGSDVVAMLQPWRLFILLVPVSSALLLAAASRGIFAAAPRSRRQGPAVRWACSSMLLVAAVLGIATTLGSEKTEEPGTELVARVAATCTADDVYLIPPSWQGFRLETRCPVLVDRKSHPYRDVEVLEWRDRLRAASAFYDAATPEARAERLVALRSRWRVTHAVVGGPRAGGAGNETRWRIVDLREGAR